MAPLRDFRRLVDGAALVALEAARRSRAAEAARSGGVEAVLSAALKRTVVAATDIAGITRGRPLEVSSPQSQDSVVYFHDTPDSAPTSGSCLGGGAQPSDRHSSEPTPRESVVYFESPAAASGSCLEASQPHGGAVEKDQDLDIRIKEEKRELGNLGGDREGKDPNLDFPREGEQKGPVFDARREEDNSGGGGGADDAGTIQMKRRRPRERRVPSTPIGRAIG